jgi:hypothetical protein
VTGLAIALLIVAGLVTLASLAAGIARYRAVMRRRWPDVPPGNDDDW